MIAIFFQEVARVDPLFGAGFRAQFFPPPVLDAIYRAYTPTETITMNGFAYEIWRPNMDDASAGTGAE